MSRNTTATARTRKPSESSSRSSRSTSTALAKAPPNVLGTHRETSAIQAALDAAHEKCILASPLTTALPPEGVAVAFSGLKVDVAEDTYKIPGGDRRGLSGTTLFRIAAAAGISFDSQRSGRLDDGSDPRYCRWRAVAFMRAFDGSEVEVVGEKEVDMRDDSPQVEQLREQTLNTAKKYAKNNATRKQIENDAEQRFTNMRRQILLHIQSHAETKAQLRAVRKALGLRSSYEPDDLRRKPLVVARAVFTGESSDPTIRRENAAAIRNAFLGGRRRLFDASPREQQPAQLPPPPVAEAGDEPDSGDFQVFDEETGEFLEHAPPADDEDRFAGIDEDGPTDDEPEPEPEPEPEDDGEGSVDEPVFKFGRNKDEPLSTGSDRDLAWYAGVLEESIKDPRKAKWKAANERDLADVNDERDAREAGR